MNRLAALTAKIVPGALFVLVLSIYFISNSASLDSPDGSLMFRVTRALVEDRGVSIEPISFWPEFGVKRVAEDDGTFRHYSKYGLGLSLVSLPFYMAGKALLPTLSSSELKAFQLYGNENAPDPPESLQYQPSERVNTYRTIWYATDQANLDIAFLAYTTAWTNQVVVALVVLLTFLIGRQIGFSELHSCVVALSLALASPLWHHSKAYFSEPLAAFAILLAIYLLKLRSSTGSGVWALAAGVALGFTVLVKAVYILILPPFLWYCFRRFERSDRKLVFFMFGYALPLAIFFYYNHIRFGSPLETGYGEEVLYWFTPLWSGVLGLLVSPGHGLLLYAPLVLIGLFALGRFKQIAPDDFWLFTTISLILLVVHGKWYRWEGGWCWGVRFLLPVIPLLAIASGAVLMQWRRAFWSQRIIVVVLLLLSLTISVSGVLVHFIDYQSWLEHVAAASHQERFAALEYRDYLVRWSFRYSSLVGYWSFPVKDYFAVSKLLPLPGVLRSLYLGAGVMALGSGLLLLTRLRAQIHSGAS